MADPKFMTELQAWRWIAETWEIAEQDSDGFWKVAAKWAANLPCYGSTLFETVCSLRRCGKIDYITYHRMHGRLEPEMASADPASVADRVAFCRKIITTISKEQ